MSASPAVRAPLADPRSLAAAARRLRAPCTAMARALLLALLLATACAAVAAAGRAGDPDGDADGGPIRRNGNKKPIMLLSGRFYPGQTSAGTTLPQAS